MNKELDEVSMIVLEKLSQSGHSAACDDLKQLVERLKSSIPEQRRALAEAISLRCHPRWLGDLAVESETLESWWNLLSRLSRVAQRAARKRTGSEQGNAP